MEIPILITGDDAVGYTATDCFGRTATAKIAAIAIVQLKQQWRQELVDGQIVFGNLELGSVAHPDRVAGSWSKEDAEILKAEIAEIRRIRDEEEARQDALDELQRPTL